MASVMPKFNTSSTNTDATSAVANEPLSNPSSKRPRLDASTKPPSVDDYFQKHSTTTDELMKTILAASACLSTNTNNSVVEKSKAPQINNDAVHGLLEQAAIQFINLRDAQRQASFLLERKAEAVRQRRLQIEKGNLLLQNLIYEKACMEREISACKDFHLMEISTMACDETKGAPNDPSTLTTEQLSEVIKNFLGSDLDLPSSDRQLHQHRLDFIMQQRTERELLKQELENSLSKKSTMESENESKRQFLTSLPTQLELIEKATLPLQKYFKLRSSELKERFARAKQLSRPLYILCSQLAAYVEYAKDDEGTEMSVEVLDAVQYDQQKKVNDTGRDNVEDQPENEQQNESANLKDILQADPLAVMLKLRRTKDIGQTSFTTSHFEIEIRFQFIPKLNIVTAEAVGNPRLLINLFPGDTGETFPNLSIYHDESLVDDQITSILFGSWDEFPGRPFLWAQRLAGMMFLPEMRERNERLEPSTKAVFRQLHRRVRAQAVLRDLLSALSSRPCPIPVHHSMGSDWFLTRGPDSAALVYWSEVQQSSKICHLLPLFGYEDQKTQAVQGRWCRYFRAKLQRRTDHVLTIFVEIPPDYPARPPRWLLQSPISAQRQDESAVSLSGQMPQHDKNMKLIEMEVNTEYSDLIVDEEEETFDWILVHQLRKIMACWDALFDEGPDHASVVYTPVTKESDRCKTLAFDRYANANI
jgi:hypothetical protein